MKEKKSTHQSGFSDRFLILPQTLVGDLSQFAQLPENSIVRQATIVDMLFKAAVPILRYIHHIEEIQKAVSLIAKQA